MKNKIIALILIGVMYNANAICPSTPTDERFEINGAEVLDNRTGLTWRRCAEGQNWSGSNCTGSATTFTHEGALNHAKMQTAWRLPNIKELASLADRGCKFPAIDTNAFPGTSNHRHWSSTPTYDSRAAFAIPFDSAIVDGVLRSGSVNGHVRLVRASQ